MKCPLVLSVFPGIGLLDRGFEDEGFCVVRGPDLLWGGDVRKFTPPSGRFDGVIGGPPCQAFSSMSRIARARGHRVAPNLIPEFERVVGEAGPRWFLMENVPQAPKPVVPGFVVVSLTFNNRWAPDGEGSAVGAEQDRERVFSFGTRDGLRLAPDVALWECPRRSVSVLAGNPPPAVLKGGNGSPKLTPNGRVVRKARQSVAGDVLVRVGTVTANATTWNAAKQRPESSRTEAYFREAVRLQGLPGDFDLPGFTVAEKIRAVGNGVPYPMARAIAKAAREAIS